MSLGQQPGWAWSFQEEGAVSAPPVAHQEPSRLHKAQLTLAPDYSGPPGSPLCTCGWGEGYDSSEWWGPAGSTGPASEEKWSLI